MWEPTKCCCCCDTRTGSIVIGVILLVGGAFGVLSGVQNLTLHDKETYEAACEKAAEPSECYAEFKKIAIGTGTASLVTSSFHIIFSSFLLYGVVKKKTAFFIPLMVIYTIQIGIMILAGVSLIGVLLYLQIGVGIVFISAVIFGLMIFLETYCLLVIRAHYLQIKREKGQIHTALEEQTLEAPPHTQVPYPTQQVPVHYGNDPPPYPGCNAPLYPDMEKFPK